MAPALLEAVDLARGLCEAPWIVSSGIRCPEHNRAENGSPASSHLTGHAVDILCRSSAQRLEMIQACLGVGLFRLGLGKTFIHIDNDPNKPACVWLY